MIKKIAFIVLCVLLNSFFAISQSITGLVFDEKEEPIIGASVYFDGTALGTTTDRNGKFTILLKKRINSPLVISCIGYETVFIKNPFDNSVNTIYLSPKPFQIKEVVIRKDQFTRKQKLKIFKEQFLGTTKAGRSCIIQNENDIDLRYDHQTNTLVASSDKPIVITNVYLGYKLTLDLVDFDIKFNKNSIKSGDVRSSLFLVTSFFTNTDNNLQNINRRRNRSYLGSQLHFFRSLANNEWEKNKFKLFNGSLQVNPDQYFTITDTLDLKKVIIERDSKEIKIISSNPDIKIPFVSSFNLLYRNRKQSTVIFRTNTIFIDKNGNNSSPDLIDFSGEMGEKRIGDLLPSDFEEIVYD
jgi:hypothetical protein